jgi:ankyrin repeat protein
MFAARKGFADIVNFLLVSGVNADIKDSLGKGAKELAQDAGFNDVAKLIASYQQQIKR